MTTDTIDKRVQEYTDTLVDLLKPGVGYKLVKPEVDRARKKFLETYTVKPTKGAELESEYNKIATAYLVALRGVGVDSPHLAGNEMKLWLQRLGNDALPKVKAAIEIGDQTQILSLFEQAYQASADKVETKMAELREQPDNVRLGVYGKIGGYLGDVNGYKGSAISVSENPAAALQALGQRLGTAKTFSKN